jgi:DNA-binding PadR family transcriptional regulator
MIFWILLFFWYFMRLTHRQEDFIGKLIELYRELQGPIHYSSVANRLGVSEITAYDMLRLLEEKGLVSSQYELANEKSGPGRSKILFLPTPRAHRIMEDLAGSDMDAGWEAIRERVLTRIREGDLEGEELTREVLARMPPEGLGSLRNCVEIMTVLALRLQRSDGRKLLLEYVQRILPTPDSANRANLSLLGGIAMGLLAQENSDDPEWGFELLEHVKRFQSHVVDMEPKDRHQLAINLLEVFEPFKIANQ